MSLCELSLLLNRYHDGEVSPAQREQVERHLRDCAPCAAELEQLSAISRTFASAILPKASPQLIARLESLAEHVQDPALWRLATRLTAAAAAILIAASIQWVVHGPAVPQRPAVDVAINDVLESESVASAAGTDSAAPEVQIQLISQDLSGGRP